jgi:hypothetical protein
MPIVQRTKTYTTWLPENGEVSPKFDANSQVTWGMLNQRHSKCDDARIDKLKLLLNGKDENDKSICLPGNAKKFIKPLRAETANAYADRVSFACYQNNFGQIINELASTLFSKPLSIVPAPDSDDPNTPGEEPDPNSPYMQLQAHFTLDDQKMEDFLKVIQTESNATGCAYFGADFKEDGKTPYAYYIDPACVLDWEVGDDDKFIFLVLRYDTNQRTSIRENRNNTTSTFLVYNKGVQVDVSDDGSETNPKGVVTLEKYVITYSKDEVPKDETSVPKVKLENDDYTTSFIDIPVICFSTPDDICAGALIGDLQASIFMRYTTFLFCVNRGINPILVYKQGAELPANGDLSDINEDGERGDTTTRTATASGKAVIGPNDDLTWEGPDKGPYEIAQDQLDKDKNEMYRLMASLSSIIGKTGVSTAQKSEQSGVAKAMDNLAKESMLAAQAKLVKKYAIQFFKLVFDALKQTDIEWKPQGMDNYRVIDETDLLAKVTALPTYRSNVPSLTSYLEVLTDVAHDMHPYTSPAILNKVMDELRDAVSQMKPAPDPMQAIQAEQDAKNAPPGTAKPGAKKPAVNSKGGSDAPPISPQAMVNKDGNMEAQTGSHLQDGTYIDPQVIFDQLKEDYNPKDIKWVLQCAAKGPMAVPLSDIDFGNAANWQASQEPDKVQKFADMIANEGFDKPIILANVKSNNNKMIILDGHHRALAYQQSGQPAMAYVLEVGQLTPEMAKMHDKQAGSKQSSKQKSNQKTN